MEVCMHIRVLPFILLFFFVGCDIISSDSTISFDDWMSCPVNKEETTADLEWLDFDVSTLIQTLPGDTVLLSIRIKNTFDPSHAETPDISASSNLRVFMEDVDADPNTIGTIGPEDIFLAEFVVPGLVADEIHTIVENVTIPKINPFSMGFFDGEVSSDAPDLLTFTIYGLVDAQDCIGERDETNNKLDATINGSSSEIIVRNPYLPNLQVRYIRSISSNIIQHTGGEISTEWELQNVGLGKVTDNFDITVFLSEDGEYDIWDECIGNNTIKSEVSGGESRFVRIRVSLPYVTWRNNGWSLFSAFDKYDSAKGDEMKTRELPPCGPPGYMFFVYPCIPGSGQIIAVADPQEQDKVKESNESDNYSTFGSGAECLIVVESANSPGSEDIELLDFRAANYIHSHGGNAANVYDIAIRYSASIQYAENCSFGFYWSKDDTASFADYFIQRYWFQIQPGTDILLYPFGINWVWKPDPLPPAGTYRMVMVMDDIYKFAESDESNNAKASMGTVTVN